MSHAFHMEDWTPERHDIVDGRDIFLWTIPAQVEGLWRVSASGYRDFVLRVWQQFDRVQGTAITPDEQSTPVADMTISGPEIQFSLNTRNGVYTFTGNVDNERMTGERERAGKWSAEKM